MRNASFLGGSKPWLYGALLLMSVVWGQALFTAEIFAAVPLSEQSIIQLTNQERRANGLAPLEVNSQLMVSSHNKAEHMVAHDYWSHDAPDGTTPWSFIRAAGVNYSTAGENLARGYLYSDSVVSGWMSSDLHRANILNPEFTSIGIGIVYGYSGGRDTAVVAAHYTAVKGTSTPSPAPQIQRAPEEPARQQVTTASRPEVKAVTPSEPAPTPPEIRITGSWWKQIRLWWSSYVETDVKELVSIV